MPPFLAQAMPFTILDIEKYYNFFKFKIYHGIYSRAYNKKSIYVV